MNDKIKRFTQQLSEAAPMPPDLDGRITPATKSPLTAMRIGMALAAVATLTAVGILSTRGADDRESVTPATASVSSIGVAVTAALPAGFSLQRVERTDTSAHAYAVNDRFEVLDIEIIPTAPSDFDCITKVTSETASECLRYADETGSSAPPATVPDADIFVLDAFGHDLNGVPAPFTGYAAQSEGVFVGVVLYGINGTTDTKDVAETVLRNVQSIGDLKSAINSLPEALTAIDPNLAAPNEGEWSGRGLAIGSLSVSLVTKAPSNDTAGSVLVRVMFPGNLTGSGNDGSVYWHATTGADGRAYIAFYRPGDENMITPADATALTQKFAEEAYGDVAAIVESSGTYPATPAPPATSAPVTEPPVDGTTDTTIETP